MGDAGERLRSALDHSKYQRFHWLSEVVRVGEASGREASAKELTKTQQMRLVYAYLLRQNQ